MTTKDIREILAGYSIDSVSLEYKNDAIAEEFKIASPGTPYKFTLSHKGTAVSMANAFNSYIGSTPKDCGESVLMQMHDASNAVKAAIIGKPNSVSA